MRKRDIIYMMIEIKKLRFKINNIYIKSLVLLRFFMDII